MLWVHGESAVETLANAEPALTENPPSNSDAISQALVSLVDDNNAPTAITNDNSLSLLDGLKIIARQSNLWISAGGMHVRGAPPSDEYESRVYNTHVILDNHGEVKQFYRKIHLFDVHLPGKVDLRESRTTAPGEELVVCDSPIGRLGLSTCYDVRFPEMYIELVDRGAEILLVPSAFTVPTGSPHWHTLLQARAIENQCFVIAAAQFGQHNSKRSSYGHSLIVNPWGEVLADAGGVDSTNISEPPPSIITCAIDLQQIRSIQRRMPIQSHRKIAKWT